MSFKPSLKSSDYFFLLSFPPSLSSSFKVFITFSVSIFVLHTFSAVKCIFFFFFYLSHQHQQSSLDSNLCPFVPLFPSPVGSFHLFLPPSSTNRSSSESPVPSLHPLLQTRELAFKPPLASPPRSTHARPELSSSLPSLPRSLVFPLSLFSLPPHRLGNNTVLVIPPSLPSVLSSSTVAYTPSLQQVSTPGRINEVACS